MTAQAGADLRRFWGDFRDSPSQGAIGLGLRRLRTARERKRDDERVLDLVIAAEALLLPPNDDHSELSFRTSLNGAFLLEDTAPARRRVCKRLQGAYSVRSTIAHGGEAKALSIEGATVDLKSLADEIDEIVRRVLERRLASDVDWQTIVTGLPALSTAR